jgi:hypothetical protein
MSGPSRGNLGIRLQSQNTWTAGQLNHQTLPSFIFHPRTKLNPEQRKCKKEKKRKEKKIMPYVKKTRKKKLENLTFVPSLVGMAIREMRLAELGERSSPMETPPVKKNGWLGRGGRERERECVSVCVCVCLPPVKNERERERCRLVETAPVKKEGRSKRGSPREREKVLNFLFLFGQFVCPFSFVSFLVCFLFKK